MAYKILIIDDDAELLKMLKKYLEIKRYEIITAENGLEGLNKIKLQPDIILLDVNMPNMDGIEVCRRVRDKVSCPIIFLTARVDEQDVGNGLSCGRHGAKKRQKCASRGSCALTIRRRPCRFTQIIWN